MSAEADGGRMQGGRTKYCRINAFDRVFAFPISGYPSEACWLNQIYSISLEEKEVQGDEASIFTSLSTLVRDQDLEDVATDRRLFA